MVVWRRWIFPILMVLIFGVIAAALVKIAFFPDEAEAAVEPSAQIADTVVAVERGDVVNALTLRGRSLGMTSSRSSPQPTAP